MRQREKREQKLEKRRFWRQKKETQRESVRKKEKIIKNIYIATCYSKVLVVAPYCSKLLKLLRFGTFDVEHILVF